MHEEEFVKPPLQKSSAKNDYLRDSRLNQKDSFWNMDVPSSLYFMFLIMIRDSGMPLPSFPEILFRQPLTGLYHLPLSWSTAAASKHLEDVAGIHPPRSRPSTPCPGWPRPSLPTRRWIAPVQSYSPQPPPGNDEGDQVKQITITF